MKRIFKKKEKGFSLIELMTALSIFIIIMTISMGSILSIYDANKKARALKTVMDNLNFSIESMSREIRFGKNYHCGASGTLTVPQNCSSGDTSITFLSSDNIQITYRKNGTILEKSVDSRPFIAVTAPEITIEEAAFYVLGATTGDTLQPRVLIRIKGYAGARESIRSTFSLQTTMSQRQLDR